MSLPIILDAKEAIDHYTNKSTTDAEKAFLIGFLSQDGYSNKAIREVLAIDKVYTVTHYKRAGTSLTEEELTLWHKNPNKISLGHVRAICKMPFKKREPMLRDLLVKNIPVHRYSAIAKGENDGSDTDIKTYESEVSATIGRGVKISYNPAKKVGSITLDFYSLDDLDTISDSLGYKKRDN